MATLKELMALRAPNTSGVDTKAVIQAMGANPQSVTTVPTYAFGMNVGDAQKEAQSGAQAQSERMRSMESARDAAMRQDAQLFDMAMQAHSRYVAERNIALAQEADRREAEMHKVMLSKNEAERDKAKKELELLELKVTRAKEQESYTIPVPDPRNPGKFIDMNMSALEAVSPGATAKLLTKYGEQNKLTDTQKKLLTQINGFIAEGFSPETATGLANKDPTSLIKWATERAIEDVKRITSAKGPAGLPVEPDWGEAGSESAYRTQKTMEYLKPTLELSPDEWKLFVKKRFGVDLDAKKPQAVNNPNAPQRTIDRSNIDAFVDGFFGSSKK